MNVTLIPESAPFSDEQRAWLNGFFAGMMGFDGNAHSLAEMPGESGPEPEAEEFPWHDPSLPMDDRLKLTEAKPIERKLMAAMAQLDCGACGYVCQTYAEAIASGSESSLTKCSPGGKDTSRMLKLLLKDAPANGTAPATSAAPKAKSGPGRDAPASVPVLELRNLNKPGSAKHTTHVELDLAGSGVDYRVGDSLGVYPINCPELVEDILAELGAAGDDGLRDELTHRRCLSDVTDESLGLLARAAVNGRGGELTKLIEDPDALDGRDVLDVLRGHPFARPDPAEFVRTLGPIAPRLYSISSSPKAHPGRVHLTVGRVEYERHGRKRKGVASTMFADRLRPGDRVRVFAQKSHGFTVPADPDAPLIMVGPGTGIAPFRAFLQERLATGAGGRNWLFFGDQRGEFDFLYADELGRYFSEGALTYLDTAFSRDQEVKVYVQDRMRQRGEELYAWLEKGAHFCVCGDARWMARDVDKALREIVADFGGKSAEQADEYVRRLAAEKRYLRDVY